MTSASARAFLISCASVSLLLATWQLAGHFHFIDTSYFPTPSEVLSSGFRALRAGQLSDDIIKSSQRLILGVSAGTLTGFTLGLCTGRLMLPRAILGPLLHVWRALPAVSLVPVFIRLIGLNETTGIIIVAGGVIGPVWVSTHTGASLVPVDLLCLAKNLELGFLKRMIYFVIPASLGYAISGIRTGIAVGIALMFISEWMMGGPNGLGYRLSVAYQVGNHVQMFYSLAMLGALSFGLDSVFIWAVRAAFPWIKNVG